MAWPTQQCIADLIASLISRIDLCHARRYESVAGCRPPVRGRHNLQLGLEPIGRGCGEVRVASLERRRRSIHVLDQIGKTLGKVTRAQSNQIGPEIGRETDFGGPNFLRVQTGTANRVERRTSLVERRCIERTTDRCTKPERGHDPDVRANSVRCKSLVVRVVVDPPAQRIRETVEWSTKDLGIPGDVMTRGTERVGLGSWCADIARPAGAVLMFFLVCSADGNRGVGWQEEREPSLDIPAIVARSERRVLRRRRAKRDGDILGEVGNIIAASEQPRLNVRTQISPRVEANGEAVLGTIGIAVDGLSSEVGWIMEFGSGVTS